MSALWLLKKAGASDIELASICICAVKIGTSATRSEVGNIGIRCHAPQALPQKVGSKPKRRERACKRTV